MKDKVVPMIIITSACLYSFGSLFKVEGKASSTSDTDINKGSAGQDEGNRAASPSRAPDSCFLCKFVRSARKSKQHIRHLHGNLDAAQQGKTIFGLELIVANVDRRSEEQATP